MTPNDDPVETWLRAHAKDSIPDHGFTDQVMSRLAVTSAPHVLPLHTMIRPLAWAMAGCAVMMDLLPEGLRWLSDAAYLASTTGPVALTVAASIVGLLVAGVALGIIQRSDRLISRPF